jgi:hypothetical protein
MASTSMGVSSGRAIRLFHKVGAEWLPVGEYLNWMALYAAHPEAAEGLRECKEFKVEMSDRKPIEPRSVAEAPLSPLAAIPTLPPTSFAGKLMEIDLHGYGPADIVFSGALEEIARQAWEMGCKSLTLIHGHGRGRGLTPGFVNTNTGYFGLCVRRALREDAFRRWTFRTTLYRGHDGSTSIRMKPNPSPTRTEMDSLEAIVARH